MLILLRLLLLGMLRGLLRGLLLVLLRVVLRGINKFNYLSKQLMKHANPFHGYRLRELREKECLSLKTFGKLIGLHPRTIQQFETSRTYPTDETEQKFCQFFKVDDCFFRN